MEEEEYVPENAVPDYDEWSDTIVDEELDLPADTLVDDEGSS